MTYALLAVSIISDSVHAYQRTYYECVLVLDYSLDYLVFLRSVWRYSVRCHYSRDRTSTNILRGLASVKLRISGSPLTGYE